MRQRGEKLTSRDEGVKDNLRSVKEISKLSLPDGQKLRLRDAHAVFKSEHGLFRQRAVTHLKTRHQFVFLFLNVDTDGFICFARALPPGNLSARG